MARREPTASPSLIFRGASRAEARSRKRSAADEKRFVDDVTKVTEQILVNQPAIKAEYDALRAAAQRHRK